jgi:hypothetical protein
MNISMVHLFLFIAISTATDTASEFADGRRKKDMRMPINLSNVGECSTWR